MTVIKKKVKKRPQSVIVVCMTVIVVAFMAHLVCTDSSGDDVASSLDHQLLQQSQLATMVGVNENSPSSAGSAEVDLKAIISQSPPIENVVAAAAEPRVSETSKENSGNIQVPSQQDPSKATDTEIDPVAQSSQDRILLFRPHRLGLNNQLQCVHTAGVLALHYNRTLVVPRNGYQGSKHAKDPIPFFELFDEPNVQVPVRVLEQGDEYDEQCNATVTEFAPEYQSTAALARDPSPEASCIVFECKWGDLHHATPKKYFPQVDRMLFPLHPRFRLVAQRVVQSIKEKLVNKTKSSLNLLGMHVRQGDTNAYPLFDCPSTQLYPLVKIFDTPKYIKRWRIMCSKKVGDHREFSTDVMKAKGLSWPRLFEHFWECPSKWPLCASNYDAVFIATNDLDMVQHQRRPNFVFTMQDFPTVGQLLCEDRPMGCSPERSKVEEFLVEEAILTLANVFQPSIPSTVTDIVLHNRLHEHPNDARDASLYHAHDTQLLEFNHAKKLAQIEKSGLGVSEELNQKNKPTPCLSGKVLRGTSPASSRELILQEKAPFHNLVECRYFAALLARHDDRMLVLPPDDASEEPRDDSMSVMFNEIFDMSNVNVSIGFSNDEVLNCDSKPSFGSQRGQSDGSCAQVTCHDLTTANYRPILLNNENQPLFFPPIYKFLAGKIVNSMKGHTRKWHEEDFSILGIYIANGTSAPLLSNYEVKEEKHSSWGDLLEDVIHCKKKKTTLCAKDYDAVFIVSEDEARTQKFGWKKSKQNVFVLQDIDFIRRHLCKGTPLSTCTDTRIRLQERLVHQLVLAMSKTFVPSNPSVPSDLVLQLRQTKAFAFLDTH